MFGSTNCYMFGSTSCYMFGFTSCYMFGSTSCYMFGFTSCYMFGCTSCYMFGFTNCYMFGFTDGSMFGLSDRHQLFINNCLVLIQVSRKVARLSASHCYISKILLKRVIILRSLWAFVGCFSRALYFKT